MDLGVDDAGADDLLGGLEQFGEEGDFGSAADALETEDDLFDELEEFKLDDTKSAKVDADDGLALDLGGDSDFDITAADLEGSNFDLGMDAADGIDLDAPAKPKPSKFATSQLEEPDADIAPASELAEPAKDETLSELISNDVDDEAKKDTAKQDAAKKDKLEADQYIREQLGAGSAAKNEKLMTALWSSLIVLLIAVLLTQVLYFKRADFMKSPSMVPLLETMCSVVSSFAPCDLPLPRDLDKIVMAEREVISHPNTEGALLITAQVVSEAEFVQPYPQLELSFSDLNQNLIARRTFEPEQYLAKDVDIAKGMSANVPVRIVLEIVDPGKDAVNFAFNYR
jgi:hypothetical protein